MFESFAQLKEEMKNRQEPLYEVIIQEEMAINNKNRLEIIERLQKSLHVMQQSLKHGLETHVELPIKQAMEQSQKMLSKAVFLSKDIKEAVCWAMAIAEYNSGMGLICAAPTAGSSGILPAVLFKARDMLEKADTDLIGTLAIAGMVGVIIGNNATLSGSEGGCQAEVGVSSAMAAAAAVHLADGTIDQIIEAVGLALKNVLGLVCDPVAGLVISPCIKRNALGVINAFLAAEMALSGVNSVIPTDEIIDALKRVGQQLPLSLRETGLGGIASSPTGKKLKKEIFGKK